MLLRHSGGQLVVRLKPLHFSGFALLRRNHWVHSLADLESVIKLLIRSLSHYLETSVEVSNKIVTTTEVSSLVGKLIKASHKG